MILRVSINDYGKARKKKEFFFQADFTRRNKINDETNFNSVSNYSIMIIITLIMRGTAQGEFAFGFKVGARRARHLEIWLLAVSKTACSQRPRVAFARGGEQRVFGRGWTKAGRSFAKGERYCRRRGG